MKNLTEVERKILNLLKLGYDSSQISNIIYISIHTVKAHVSSIKYKLEAKNRCHAVYIAVKNNLIN